jgi:hypothetical protein
MSRRPSASLLSTTSAGHASNGSRRQRRDHRQIKDFDETGFVKFRMERDRSLPLPDLMLAALQVNIAGGRLPAPEIDGRRYLKIPLNALTCA